MADEHNGRVTMAVLSTKMDTVIGKLDDFCERVRVDHDRLQRVETMADENKRTIERLWVADTEQDERIRQIDTRNKIWVGINSALVFVGSALGMKINLP